MEHISIKDLIIFQTIKRTPEGAPSTESSTPLNGKVLYIFTEHDPKTRKAYRDYLEIVFKKLIGSEMSDKLIIADLNQNENEEEIKQALKPDNLNQLIVQGGIRGIVIFADNLFLDPSSRRRNENFGFEILTEISQFKNSNKSRGDFKRRVVLVGASNDYFSPMLTDYDYLKFELPFFIQNLLPKITKSFFDK